jgi:hypothetical protein
MKYFSSFFYNKNSNIYVDVDRYINMFATSSFISQKNFKDFYFYTQSDLTNKMSNKFIAFNNIKIFKINNFFKFNSFWPYSKIVSAQHVNGPFCSIDVDLFLWNPEKLINNQNDFFFCSVNNNPKEFISSKPHGLGLKILKELNVVPESLKDVSEENIDFPIFNLSIFQCKRYDIFEKYLNELELLLLKSNLIDDYVNNNPIIGNNSTSTAISCALEELLVSKIIHDNKCSYDSYYNNDNYELLSKKFPLKDSDFDKDKIYCTHLGFSKSSPHSIQYIDLIYNEIYNKNLTINKYLEKFFDSDFDSNSKLIPYNNDLYYDFISEKNTGGGCSACKLRRLKSKYYELLYNRIFQTI